MKKQWRYEGRYPDHRSRHLRCYISKWRGEGESLCWPDLTDERIPLHQLLLQAYDRYKKPMFLSETGHFGEGRAEWINEIANETSMVAKIGADFHGICIYPVTDRPDWDNLSSYSNCGLFDLDEQCNRIAHTQSIAELRQIMELQNTPEHVNH